VIEPKSRMIDRQQRQRAVAEWVEETFGKDQAKSQRIRCLRFIEEAFELVQSLNLSKHECIKVANAVYKRKSGAPIQELGGVGITLLALADSIGHDADCAESMELNRVLSKDKAHFQKRNAEKIK